MNQSLRPKGLVVDDTDAVRQFAVAVLCNDGYRVVSAGSATEGLRAAFAEPGEFDFLLTDYELGDGTGAELASAVRRLFPGLPVVIMSGRHPEELPGVGIADIFLPKPFSVDSLRNTVSTVLSRTCGKDSVAA
jgi:DNA-binding response OmpR family regulator